MLLSIESKLLSLIFTLVLLAGVCFASYLKGVEHGKESFQQQYEAAIQKQNVKIKSDNSKIQVISDGLETNKQKQKQVENKANAQVNTEISKPVYTQCVVPSSGVQYLNTTATELNAIRHPGKPASNVP